MEKIIDNIKNIIFENTQIPIYMCVFIFEIIIFSIKPSYQNMLNFNGINISNFIKDLGSFIYGRVFFSIVIIIGAILISMHCIPCSKFSGKSESYGGSRKTDFSIWQLIDNILKLIFFYLTKGWTIYFGLLLLMGKQEIEVVHNILFPGASSYLSFVYWSCMLITAAYSLLFLFYILGTNQNTKYYLSHPTIKIHQPRLVIINESSNYLFLHDQNSSEELFHLAKKSSSDNFYCEIIDTSNNFFEIKYEFEVYNSKN